MRKVKSSIFLVVVLASCGAPAARPDVPPVTTARVSEETPKPFGSAPAPTAPAHAVRAKLETDDATVFLLYRDEKGASCERVLVKAGAGEKKGQRVLEIDASSPKGCWTGKASATVELQGDHADVTETRVSGQQFGHVMRCMKATDAKAANIEAVSETELRVDGTHLFTDEGTCKAALAPAASRQPSQGCLAKAVSSAIAQRRPPPSGAFVDRFEKLIKIGGTVWSPSEKQRGVCLANKIASKPETVKGRDVLQVTLTSTSVEEGTKWVDTTTYEYDPACKRARLAGFSGEGTNADGSRSGRAGSTLGNASDLEEQEDAKDALPIAGMAFYAQAPCIAWSRANPPSP